MYDENNRNFALKDLIIKILFIVIIAFIIIWLFPTKGYVSKVIDKKIGVSENQVFNDNLNTIKNATLGYYNGDRLPQTKEKMTLMQMLDKNLLTEIIDSEGKACDTEKSYVEITKSKDDYKLKVNLNCQNKEAYVISYFGSYDYCAGDVCEKKKLTENETPNNEQTKTDECQYSKTQGGYWSNYGRWSNWTTKKINSSNSRQVQTKVQKVQVGTKTIQKNTTQKQTPKKLTYSNGAVIYECANGFDNAGRYTSPKYCIKTIVKTEKIPVYKNVTYYKYRDRKYINNNSDYKWSTCNDEELLKNGYTKTGQTR